MWSLAQELQQILQTSSGATTGFAIWFILEAILGLSLARWNLMAIFAALSGMIASTLLVLGTGHTLVGSILGAIVFLNFLALPVFRVLHRRHVIGKSDSSYDA